MAARQPAERQTKTGDAVGTALKLPALAGDDVRGVTVHEAARIMAVAKADEILVSEAIAMLCRSGELSFEDAGEHELKGFLGRWHLYRAVE